MGYKQSLGRLGEQLAAKYLITHGFTIRQTNFRVREGEIDIVAEKNNVIHFVEVKTRTTDGFGFPEEAVDDYKLEKIITAGWRYLQNNNLILDWQIDIISLRLNKNQQNGLLKFIPNIE